MAFWLASDMVFCFAPDMNADRLIPLKQLNAFPIKQFPILLLPVTHSLRRGCCPCGRVLIVGGLGVQFLMDGAVVHAYGLQLAPSAVEQGVQVTLTPTPQKCPTVPFIPSQHYSVVKDIPGLQFCSMQAIRKVIVTGCNKGIGFGIAQKLAARPGWVVIMAVRNLQLGEQAKQQILKANPGANINLELLDVSDAGSVSDFKKVIQEKYETVDVVINNAGVSVKGDEFSLGVLDFTFATNFYGTINFTEALIPLIAPNGKIITLGSMAGRMCMSKMGADLKARFKSEHLTEKDIYTLLDEYKAAVQAGTFEAKGWPRWGYGVSKLCVNIFFRLLSQREEVLKKGLQVYSCCPGYVKTDMTSHKGVLTVEQGITTPVYLFDLPFKIDEKIQGGFFEKCSLSSTFV